MNAQNRARNWFSGETFVWLAMLLLCIAGSMDSARCQTAAYTGTITGIVTDSVGAVVAGAAVVATNTATGLRTATQTNQDGAYTISTIAAGTYTVRIEAPGFQAFEKSGVLLDPNSVARADCALTVGKATETVQVTESAPLLETQQATFEQTVAHEYVESLPNVVSDGIRDITSLLNLAPGVVQGSNDFSTNIAGGRSSATELLLDGVPIVYDATTWYDLNNRPDQDVISEVQVQTGVPTAEWGHSTGGIGSFITRSGTNKYHGDAVLLLRNTVFDATPYDSLTKTQDQQFELPLTVGGPIRIPHVYNGSEKAFFFFNYSAYRKHGSSPPQPTTIPTALEQTGNFSDLNPTDDPNGFFLYDPATGMKFPAISGVAGCDAGLCIPQSRWSANSAAFLKKFFPAPTNDSLSNNYIGRTPQTDTENHYFAKIDQRIGTSHTVHGTFRWDNISGILSDGPWGELLASRDQDYGVRSLSLAHDYIIRPNLTNSLSAAYSRWIENTTGTPLNLFPQIPGTYGPGFPQIQFLSSYAVGQPIGDQNLQIYADPFWNVNEALSWQHGKHSFKFGGRYSDYIGRQVFGATENGSYYFGPWTTSGNFQPNAGNSFAGFLLGDVDVAVVNVPVPFAYSSSYYAFYGEDSWRAKPTLTFNFGLRWDINRPYQAPLGGVMDPKAPNPGAGNIPGAIVYNGPNGEGKTFFPTWFGAVGPRVGVAWNMRANTVLRAGYGILYAPQAFVIGQESFPGSFVIFPQVGTPAMQWDQGFQPGQIVPFKLGQDPSVSNGSSTSAADFTRGTTDRVEDTQIMQVDVEQSVKGFLFGAAYIGQFAHHIPAANNAIDQLPVADMKYGNLLNLQINDPAVVAAGFTLPYPSFTGTLAQALRPFPQYNGVSEALSNDTSSYHAGMFRVETRSSHGLQLIASLVISKAITDAGVSNTGLPNPQDQYNRQWEKSIAENDVPRVLSLTYNYQLPVGHGRSYMNGGVLGRALEGFQVSGTQLYQAGTPIIISAPSNTLPIFNGYQGLNRGQGPFTTGHRGSVKLANGLYNGTGGSTYLNAAAFALPPTFMIQDPNNPANTIANPAVVANPYSALGNLKYVLPNVRNLGFFNENFSLSKSQSFHDRYILNIGFDLLDAFNRRDFGGLNTTLGQAGFGQYTTNGDGPRIIQIHSKITF